MNKSEKIEKLFKEWKKAQSEEKKEYVAVTSSRRGKFNDEFIGDGLIYENIDDIKYLFILKESNAGDSECEYPKENGLRFWFEEVVKSKVDNKTTPKGGNSYYNAIGKFIVSFKCEKLKEYNPEKIDEDLKSLGEEDWKEVAYMNINKRGGASICDENKLEKYIDIYKEQIVDQINAIEPDYIIVMAGDNIFQKITSLCEEKSNRNYKIIRTCHPARYNGEKIFISAQELAKTQF